MRSVDIVATGDQAREFETAEIRLDQEFGSGLGGGVGVCGLEDVFFGHGIGVKIFTFSIHLIGRNVNESLDGRAVFGALKKDVSSVNVGLRECHRVTERVVNVGLGGKMHYCVDLFLDERVGNKIGSCDITLDKLKVGQVCEFIEVFQTTAVIQTVVNYDIILGILFAQQNGNMGGNEPCTSSEENILGSVIAGHC